MKKKLQYLFIFLICFLFIDGVNARTELTCKYVEDYFVAPDGDMRITYTIDFVLQSNTDVKVTKITGVREHLDLETCKKGMEHIGLDPEQYCYKNRKEEYKNKKTEVHFKANENDGCPKIVYVSINTNIIDIYGQGQKPEYYFADVVLSSEKIRKSDKVFCGNITGIPKKIPKLTSYIIRIVQVLVPVLLVIFGMLDLFKGITAQKEDEIKKGQSIFIKRLILAVLIFFVIVLVKVIISVIAENSSTNIIDCMDCFLSNKCN